jgi:hypothetical protein
MDHNGTQDLPPQYFTYKLEEQKRKINNLRVRLSREGSRYKKLELKFQEMDERISKVDPEVLDSVIEMQKVESGGIRTLQ